uniref:Uncharacterized protein n=1 Tax=Heterorhabditis bacteriophora TaxID=37862 RepID=A0A1I7WEF7_HETBA
MGLNKIKELFIDIIFLECYIYIYL